MHCKQIQDPMSIKKRTKTSPDVNDEAVLLRHQVHCSQTANFPFLFTFIGALTSLHRTLEAYVHLWAQRSFEADLAADVALSSPLNTVTPIVVFLTKEFLLENLFSTWLWYISTLDIMVWNNQNYTLFSVQRSASCRFRPREEAKKRPTLITGDKRKCAINKLRRHRERWVSTQRGWQSWTHISAAGTATPLHGLKSQKKNILVNLITNTCINLFIYFH